MPSEEEDQAHEPDLVSFGVDHAGEKTKLTWLLK